MIVELVTIILLTLGVLARLKRLKLTSLYDMAEKYGDPLHIAYASFAATLGAMGIQNAVYVILSAMLTAMYIIYQIADYMINHDTLQKDIAVYMAAYALTLSVKLGIPIKIDF